MEKSHNVESKERHSVSKKDEKVISRIRNNPWIISSVVLGVLVLIMIIGSFLGNVSGNVVSEDKAIGNLLNFLNGQTNGGVSYVSSTDEGSLYEVVVSYNGQTFPVYVTKDGEFYVQGVSPLSSDSNEDSLDNSGSQVQEQKIPKSERPSVELFVMSHCPYGTQAEKGILPVFKLLDESIDAGIKFVDYAMHPSKGEVEEQLNQYCIQKEEPEIYFDYLECFLEAGDSERCMEESNVDQFKLEFCASKADEEFDVMENLEDESSWMNGRFPRFDVHKELNEKYDVAGSPTLIINGVGVDSGRSPQAFLDTICNSFTEGNVPEECGTDLPNDSYKTGFGWVLSTGEATDGAKCY